MDLLLSITVVAPICIYLLIGIVIKKLNWMNEEGISQTNKIIYKLFFPTVMFSNIYSSNLKESIHIELIIYMMVMATIIFILLNLLIPLFIKERPIQGSVIQGIYRANSILFALPIVSSIYGQENTGIATVCVTIIVPFFNVFCVILLESKRGAKIKFGKLVISILKNPIIIGALLGIIIKLIGLELPKVIVNVASDMSKVVTPLALILLAAGLSFGNIKKNKWYLLLVCVSKLIIVPALFVGVAYWYGFREIELATIFALSSVPTAVSSYVMAKEMGADGPLAGEIVAFTSILSIITIFTWLLLLTGKGWI